MVNLAEHNFFLLINIAFLDHMTRKLRMSHCDHFPSFVVRPFVRRSSTHLNDFFSEADGPIFFKLHREPFVEGGLKFC